METLQYSCTRGFGGLNVPLHPIALDAKVMPTDLPLSVELLITIALYGGLAIAYLLIFPTALIFYLKARWYDVSSLERLLLYGLVFLFFPGLLLLSPFLNFRPQPRTE